MQDRHRPGIVRRFFSALGPGLITGAADDDPSGVTTYSIAGAQMGTAFLWTAFITWPLMAAVQFMCARIGMATGKGLAGALMIAKSQHGERDAGTENHDVNVRINSGEHRCGVGHA
jgi:Mn2+/Fe2+ NRAMP family transporter